jgi:transcriptional regulator with XRE-family HTH domain
MGMQNKQEFLELIGAKVRDTRNRKGLSIEKLALESGLSYSQIIRIEKGKINTSIYQLYIISNTLDVEIYNFFGEF